MAESPMFSMGIPETNITAMKEALRAQQQLLQKLYAELDEEREASATAASEALSMILRLQGEKATVKMEASQYKRMAEEKMCHAENSLAVVEDVIYQKEMEIASLEFQIQAYRYKLFSMGCSDLGAFDFNFPENMLQQKSDLSNAEMGIKGSVRRLNSLPPIAFKDYKKCMLDRETSLGPVSDVISEVVEQNTDNEVFSQRVDSMKKSGNSSSGNFNSYWEQIRRLDEQVIELSGPKESEGERYSSMVGGLRSYSSLSQVGPKKTYDRTRGIPSSDMVQVDCHETTWDGEASSSSLNVHDVFEVPLSDDNSKASEDQEKRHKKLDTAMENRLTKPEPVLVGAFEPNLKDEIEELKIKMLMTNHRLKFPDRKDKLILGQKKDAMSIDSNAASIFPTTGVAESQAQLQKLCQRIERLEEERNSIRHEISSAAGKEGLNLLKEIHEQLNSIQTEMRSWKIEKSPPKEDSSLLPLQEAMLYFWL
ncbi:Myosin-binding protein [Quillaja saponaria]|uniref:Myosin-binding protein n=1 Tax=Quillaja saponaria TaxID=32244 RepID=A0AAD7VL04_QUISA|nr:Myosin-binding protein [Quillaja saponaria]KAJ7979583.1 Myosin-binding protein [Quillaja saponaria]